MAEAGFRVGLRVEDVQAAAAFYSGLGFTEIGSVPNPQGQPVMTILERHGVQLIIDALRGMPFAETEREHQTQVGPRGLGVAIGLSVDDLDASFAYCSEACCEITCEPMDEAWGDRVFECIDPFGYPWEFSQPIEGASTTDGLETVRTSWFGTEE